MSSVRDRQTACKPGVALPSCHAIYRLPVPSEGYPGAENCISESVIAVDLLESFSRIDCGMFVGWLWDRISGCPAVSADPVQILPQSCLDF